MDRPQEVRGEVYVTKSGIYSSGVVPEIETLFELAFLWDVGPRVEEACVDHIKGFSSSAPYEDLRLKRDSR